MTTPTTTCHGLAAAPGDWTALVRAVRATWHDAIHIRAGRQRVAHAQLRLSVAWRGQAAAELRGVTLQALALHLAASGAKVEVLLVAGHASAELRLRWVAWHAPPLASVLTECPTPTPTSRSATTNPENCTMKFPFFAKTTPSADGTAAAEPRLAPQALARTHSNGAQLPLALAQVAEHIARHEVHDLLELGMSGRYRLFTLNFWVSAANQPALRNLMEINQRDPRAAKRVVEAAFAKGRSAALLDTSRLVLVFTPGDALPRDAAEVLIVSGRDTVTLAYSYQGEIDLPAPGPVAEAPSVPANAASDASGAVLPASAPPLCLWLQTAQQPVPRRWLVRGPTQVGADDSCDVVVDWSRVSGQHLRLLPLPTGGWQVQDDSRNGTLCLDAEHTPTAGNPPERPLPKGQPCPLPRAGGLRLGGGPQDPLLHFAQIADPVAAPAPVAARSAPPRRMTELGPVMPQATAAPQAVTRGTRT